MKKIILLFGITFLLLTSCTNSPQLYHPVSQKFISYEQFLEECPEDAILVLGEQHYTESIQKAQAQLIRDLVQEKQSKANFTVAWEFLEEPNQEQIQTIFQQYQQHQIQDQELLQALFPNAKKTEQNQPYLPIFHATRDLEGQLIGVNVPREWKRKLMEQGIGGLSSMELAPDFEPGTSQYFARFQEAMGEHLGAEKIDAYFLAQCYTDHQMAFAMKKHANGKLQFLVVGSFHSDYFDGVVYHLKEQRKKPVVPSKFKETPYKFKEQKGKPVITFKFEDAKTLTEEEQNALLEPSPKYGPIADYVYLLK